MFALWSAVWVKVLELRFKAKLIEWRGPAPFYFAPVPVKDSEEIRRIAKSVSYGWGVIPVEAVISGVGFRTSLFPRDTAYLLPVKTEVRRKAGITEGDTVAVSMTVRLGRR